MFEYVQIKTILKLQFEIILNNVCKRSKLVQKSGVK